MVISLAAAVTSLAALGFAILSFWWMNWRPGMLTIGSVRAYAAVATEPHLIIAIPIVFHNRGALPVIVEDLRLRFPERGGALTALRFDATTARLGNQKDGRQLAIPFPIHGGDAVVKICEFRRVRSGFSFAEGTYEIAIDARISGNDSWIEAKAFHLKVADPQAKALNSEFRAYYNAPPSDALSEPPAAWSSPS